MSATRIALAGASGWLGRALGPALLRQGIADPAHLCCINRSGPAPAYADWPGLHWEAALPAGALDGLAPLAW